MGYHCVQRIIFLKARLNGVPSIFTTKDSNTSERIIYLYKPDVPWDTHCKYVIRISEKVNKVIRAYGNINLNDIKKFITSSINEKLANEATSIWSNMSNLTIDSLKHFYEIIKNHASFNPFILTAENPSTTINNLKGKFEYFQENFFAAIKEEGNNITYKYNKLKNNIYKIINQTLYIEFIYRIDYFMNKKSVVDQTILNAINEYNEFIIGVDKENKDKQIRLKSLFQSIDITKLESVLSENEFILQYKELTEAKIDNST